MNTFEKAIEDIFNCSDFIEHAIIDGNVYEVVCSAITDDVVYTDVGLENAADFTLDIVLKKYQRLPKKGDKVEFRCKKYKVSDLIIDSANTSLKIHLVDLSKGV